MYNYFFHGFKWDNDVYVMLAIWALLIPFFLYITRFIYKSVRKTKMKHLGAEIYLCRDLFLTIGGFEYLLVVLFLSSIYYFFWCYYTSPFSANWLDWRTWIIALPQIALLITIVVLFFIRYIKFRKPYLK